MFHKRFSFIEDKNHWALILEGKSVLAIVDLSGYVSRRMINSKT